MLVSDVVVRCLCHFANLRWIALPSVGAASGVLMIWDEDCVEVETVWPDTFSATVVAAFKDDSQIWKITGCMVLHWEDSC